MAQKSFSAAVSDWIAKSEKRMGATFKTALQTTAEDATRPKAKSGFLPVDTGFLRGSFVGAVGHMPSGPSDPRTDPKGDVDDIALTIARAQTGDVFYMGFAANYARVQEAKNGFVEAAAQRWSRNVKDAAEQAKRRIK